MQHAAFARTHRGEAIGLSGAPHFLCRCFSGHLQLVCPDSLEMIRVKGNLVVLLIFEPDNLCGHVLQRAKQFTTALRQESGIRSGQFDVVNCRDRLTLSVRFSLSCQDRTRVILSMLLDGVAQLIVRIYVRSAFSAADFTGAAFLLHNHSSDPTPFSGTPPAKQEPRLR